MRGSQLAPDRQIAQAGIELIGCDSPDADAEIVLVGAEALASVGLTRISFDLTLPTLVPVLLDDAGFAGPTRAALARALDRKDAASVARHGGSAGADADRTAAGRRTGRPGAAGAGGGQPAAGRRATSPSRLAEAVAAIRARAPTLRLTVDPVEFRGFRYETGVSVTIYAPGRHEELGRGGRYVCGEAEPATGLTLFPDAVLRAAPPREATAAALCPARRRSGRGCADAPAGLCHHRRAGAGRPIRRPKHGGCRVRTSCATAARVATDRRADAWPMSR